MGKMRRDANVAIEFTGMECHLFRVMRIEVLQGLFFARTEGQCQHPGKITAGASRRVPRIGDQTLVDPQALLLPGIPGLEYNQRHNGSGDRDFGPRVRFNRGVVDLLLPEVLAAHKVLVPQVDETGNEIAGIRHPLVEAPTATLLGWNTRTREFGGPDLCDMLGSMIPLPRTEAEAGANGDPRPSLEELYGDHAGYVTKVTDAANKLQKEGLLLPEDVERIVAEAEASDVLK